MNQGISGKTLAVGAILFVGAYYLLGRAGYNPGAEAELPLFGASALDAETLKLIISAAAAIVPILWQKFPNIADVIRQLFSGVGDISKSETKEYLDRIETKIDTIAKKLGV